MDPCRGVGCRGCGQGGENVLKSGGRVQNDEGN